MTLTFAVLGDSIAYGQGASRASDSLGSRLTAELTAAGMPAELRVFAVPGARSDTLAPQVRHATAWAPRLALLVIGANDLTHFVPPRQAAAHLADAVRALRASGAQVVVTPTPDLSVVPWVPANMRAAVRTASALLRRMQTGAALAEGARVADVQSGATNRFATDLSLFCADRFHPSSAGYAVIAAALAPAVLAAAAEALGEAGPAAVG